MQHGTDDSAVFLPRGRFDASQALSATKVPSLRASLRASRGRPSADVARRIEERERRMQTATESSAPRSRPAPVPGAAAAAASAPAPAFQAIPFFAAASANRRAVTTSAGPCDLPILYADASLLTLVYAVRPELARAHVDQAGLEPLVAFGKAWMVLCAFEYRATTIGPYGELGLGVLAKRKGTAPSLLSLARDQRAVRDAGLFVTNLPVTTEPARAAGEELWGFPKYVSGIETSFRKDGVRITLERELENFAEARVPPEDGGPPPLLVLRQSRATHRADGRGDRIDRRMGGRGERGGKAPRRRPDGADPARARGPQAGLRVRDGSHEGDLAGGRGGRNARRDRRPPAGRGWSGVVSYGTGVGAPPGRRTPRKGASGLPIRPRTPR